MLLDIDIKITLSTETTNWINLKLLHFDNNINLNALRKILLYYFILVIWIQQIKLYFPLDSHTILAIWEDPLLTGVI